MTERERIRRERARKRRLAELVIFCIEIFTGIGTGTVVGALVIPAIRQARGYYAVGGEWYLIVAAAWLGFYAVHRYIFRNLEGENRCQR